jgi:hypothetical protein
MKRYFWFTLLCFYPNATTQGVLRGEYFRSNKATMPNPKTKNHIVEVLFDQPQDVMNFKLKDKGQFTFEQLGLGPSKI